MKRKQGSRSWEGLKSWLYAILVAVAIMGMSLFLSKLPAQAAVDCNTLTAASPKTDTDGDGFTDYDECRGIYFGGTAGGTFPGKTSGVSREQRLDPDTKDLFVILVRKAANQTLMPAQPSNAEDVAYWFPYIINPVGQSTAQFGLGIAVHEITATQAATDRTVCKKTGSTACQIPTGQSGRQKAVKVTESLDQTADNVFGFTSFCGTPNGQDLTTIYTQKIYNKLYSIGQLNKLHDYIKHTIAHEIGHTVGPLAPVNIPEYGLYHYQSADNGLILDQSVYQDVNNVVYIGTQFTAGDQAGIHLK